MAFRWRPDDGPTLNAGSSSFVIFQGIWTRIANKPYFCDFSGWSKPPVPTPPSGSAHDICLLQLYNALQTTFGPGGKSFDPGGKHIEPWPDWEQSDLGTYCLQYRLTRDRNWRKKKTVQPVLSSHLKENPKLVFKTNYRLMQVKSIAECSKGSILQYFRPSLSYHFVFTFVLSIFQWPFKTGFTVSA